VTKLKLLLFTLVSVATWCSAQDSNLKRFTTCNLGPDFQIVQADGPVSDIAWPAPIKGGEVSIPVEEGYRVLVTYREDEPFGNLKVERIPKKQYPDARINLLSSFDFLSSEPSMDAKVRSQKINGVTFYGVDRAKLAGGVLSVYALFQDDQSVIVSMYLLNAEPAERKFNTLAEYKTIRDEFLNAFSKCVVPAKSH